MNFVTKIAHLMYLMSLIFFLDTEHQLWKVEVTMKILEK